MAGPERASIQELSAAAALSLKSGLCALLKDVVDGGASVGFLPPLSGEEAGAYWDSVAAALTGGGRRLWIARALDGGIVGAVQLDLERRANGDHRAEVMKLMVLGSARRRGLGRLLMETAEAEARRLGRTTLVLDTRQGDPSEALYRAMGWQPAGTIPRYARSADGTLHTTAFYYKLLDPLTLPSPPRGEGETIPSPPRGEGETIPSPPRGEGETIPSPPVGERAG